MIDTKKKAKEFLEEHFNEIIININKYYQFNQGFTIRDLLSPDKDNYYYLYMTKGIIKTLIFFGHIEIFALYNGNKNFIYKANCRIGST